MLNSYEISFGKGNPGLPNLASDLTVMIESIGSALIMPARNHERPATSANIRKFLELSVALQVTDSTRCSKSVVAALYSVHCTLSGQLEYAKKISEAVQAALKSAQRSVKSSITNQRGISNRVTTLVSTTTVFGLRVSRSETEYLTSLMALDAQSRRALEQIHSERHSHEAYARDAVLQGVQTKLGADENRLLSRQTDILQLCSTWLNGGGPRWF